MRGLKILTNIRLILAALSILFIIFEIACRILDPYPYFAPWQIERTRYNRITEYDELLGWKGVSETCELMITENAKTLIKHNLFGFRDIELEQRSPGKPAIIFLGDSYTWGQDVGFDQLFVNMIRRKINQFEIFNLGHQGYGTDQSLLAFQQWPESRPISRVILMFCKNDVADNSYNFRWGMYKPKFEIIDDTLMLTNVPVPKSNNDDGLHKKTGGSHSFNNWIKYILYQSHFLHDFQHRIRLLKNYIVKKGHKPESNEVLDFMVTDRILRKLYAEVNERGGKLTIVTFPSVEVINNSNQHKQMLQFLCSQLAIDYVDLTPYFKKALFRTEYRGGHWNSRGHRIAAEAIYKYLENKGIR